MSNKNINALLVVSSFFAVFLMVYSKPVVVSDLTTCEGQPCPNNTYGCAVSTRINPNDRTQLISQVQCLGLHREVLQNTTVISRNPFGENVYFQGYRYSSSIHISSNKNPDTDIVSTKEPLGNDTNNTGEIEVFEK